MPDRVPEKWESSAPGPFMTLRSGGPLDGTVTVSITTAVERRLLVEAAWTVAGDRRSTTVRCSQFHEARTLAHDWASMLGMGEEPPR